MPNAKCQTLNPRRFLAVAAMIWASLVFAQSAADIVKQVQANLEKSPWEAILTGKVQTPDGSTQDAELRLQVVPGANRVARVEFNKPASLEGNFVVIDDKEVWNYLFLTNQVIIQPRAKAKVEGLGVNLSSLGDLEELTGRLNLRPPVEVNTPDGPAWRIAGTPKDNSLGFAQIELVVLKSDPRPLSIRLLDSSNKVLAELNLRSFKRTNLTASALRKRPADAEVVRR
ncbi:outer membrane lipoprotein carrier protein LolA [Meiothermus sp. PNK-Is4]|nr:hypothetical protein DNA98_10815 [Meiothermus sp. Pnk-1]RYM40076.1 outer membrane lipoprotein carrier protein LolA [Meiothermus sp. PNK-Is4]